MASFLLPSFMLIINTLGGAQQHLATMKQQAWRESQENHKDTSLDVILLVNQY